MHCVSVLRRLPTAGLGCLAAAAILVGCSGGGGQRSEFADVVAAAEAKTLGVQSVTVSVSGHAVADPSDKSDFVAYWRAPDRLRAESDGKVINITVANKIYSSKDGTPDRFDLMVVPTRQSDQGKISNFPVIWIGGIASRASAITFDGSEYTATVPNGDKSYNATIRIEDGYITWVRVVTPDTDNTYELLHFNSSPPVDEPLPDKVDVTPSAPLCSTPTTAPPTSIAGSGILYMCVGDHTTR